MKMSFHSYHQIEALCRGCLMADREMTSVELYKAEFKDVTGITITATDGLPQCLCYECIALLKKCVGFVNKVKKSQYKLSQYVLDKVPFVSNKESSPQLSQSAINCYDCPDSETEEQELIIKTEENGMDLPVISKVESMQVVENIEACPLPVITNVDSIRVTPNPVTPHYENEVTDGCREENAQLDDGSKCYDDEELDMPKIATKETTSSERENIDLENSNHKERTVKTEVEEEEISVADKIENHKREQNDDDTIEVWCIDEQGESTTEPQRRPPKRHKKLQEPSLVLMNTGKYPTIQAGENADEHSGGQTSQQTGRVTKKRGRKRKQATSTPRIDTKEGLTAMNINNINSSLEKEDDEDKVNVDSNDSVKVHTRGNAKYAREKRNKYYTDKILLKTQISRDHSKKKPFKCDVCMKGFGRKSTLASHKRLHSGERKTKCDVCKLSFIGKDLKKQYHLHTGKRPYKCDVCMKTFVHQSSFDAHYRTHSGVTPYNRDCMKSLSQVSDLTMYYRLHYCRLAPYKCHICLTNFKDMSTFNVHFLQHTSDKPKECKRAEELNQGVGKPFQCETCVQRFAKKHSLNTHARFCAQIHNTKIMKK